MKKLYPSSRTSKFFYETSRPFKKSNRKVFLSAWQNHKKEKITHPYLKEKVEWGLVPYIQALLLARTIREDLEEYPPFLWK